jgi:hypothetical protein
MPFVTNLVIVLLQLVKTFEALLVLASLEATIEQLVPPHQLSGLFDLELTLSDRHALSTGVPLGKRVEIVLVSDGSVPAGPALGDDRQGIGRHRWRVSALHYASAEAGSHGSPADLPVGFLVPVTDLGVQGRCCRTRPKEEIFLDILDATSRPFLWSWPPLMSGRHRQGVIP